MNHNQICKCNQHICRHYFFSVLLPGYTDLSTQGNMIADMTTRPETPTLRTQNYPVFVVLQTLLGVWQKRNYLLLLFDNISIGSSIFMDKYGLLSSIQQSRTKTLLYPMVSSCWCSLCPGLGDAFCLRPWGGSSHEKCQKIETTSLVPISPQPWKSNNIDYIVKLGIVWHWTLQ